MDINALLSPDDSSSTKSRSPSAQTSPQKSPARARPALTGGKRTASGLSQEITRSPERVVASPSSHPVSAQGTPSQSAPQPTFNAPPGSIAAPNLRPLPPTSNPLPDPAVPHQGQYGYVQQQPAYQQTQQRPVVAHRPSSTPQMETLAGECNFFANDQSAGDEPTLTSASSFLPDLASMQQRQQATRAYSANNVRGESSSASSHRPSPHSSHPHSHQQSPHNTPAPTIARTISRQSLADLTMAEAPAQTPPPRDFVSNALSDEESKTVTDLLNYLGENSYAYDHHVQLINLLHKGFLAHVNPPVEGDIAPPPGNPHTYALLRELRQAREAMDSRFAVGEDIWTDWLSDETLLASTAEERLALTETFQKAVLDEPASVKMWHLYVDWVSSNYRTCNDLEGADNTNWTTEDKEVCKELFTRQTLVEVLQKAQSFTKWRIDESHVIWNRYAQLMQEEFPANPTDTDIQQLHMLFVDRLREPHVARDETMSLYWPIISKFERDNYEEAMLRLNQDPKIESARMHTDLRGEHELKLKRAIESGDLDATRREFEKYLKSEKFHHKKPGPFDYQLRCALYERALLRFPTATEWWLDYIDFMFAEDKTGSQNLVPVIERATRHCPWSGDLWGRRILRQDVERQPRYDVENTKHRATNAGLLDVGGMEELVKMLQQWCSYLRRQAFVPSATDDELDMAEVGITAALEDVQQAGQKIYGNEFKGDPLFRLEKIHIKFLSEARRFSDARDLFQSLAARVPESSDFWQHWYSWELCLWGFERFRDQRRIETEDNGPDLPSRVLSQALQQRNLDWPEKVLELYLSHFQQHESGVKLAEALIVGRDFANRLATRRAKEAEEAAAVAAQQQEQYAAAVQEEQGAASGEKRKREDEPLTNGDSHKKAKTDDKDAHTEPSASASAQIKRDREHNTITVRNLPLDVQEKDLKKFFRDCGELQSINILKDDKQGTASATVEFETHEDVLAAKTRNGRDLNGNEVRIHSGDQTTLYVTNYPAEYDENAIRELFKDCGDIVSVRFPSLKFNSRRRFCYVSFLTSEMAKAAETAMDGKKIDGMHSLLAKIADPDAKKQRSGAQVEGREVIARNIHRDTSEEEVKKIFAEYGTIERANFTQLTTGKFSGTAFFVYSSSDEASAAVEGANNKTIRDRIMHVALSDPKGRAAPHERARKEDLIVKNSAGASASPEPSARRGSDVSMKEHDEIRRGGRENKIAVFNIPDTVNDARIRTTLEQYGPITKIQLRRELGGAIVDFEDVKDAFRVRVGVDVSGLGPEASTGDVGDFLAQKKKKVSNAPNGSMAAPSTGSSLSFVPPSASRPGRGRGGRRGGLGFKRGGAFAPGARNDAASSSNNDGSHKSNSDFRSLLEASKKKSEPADGSADQ